MEVIWLLIGVGAAWFVFSFHRTKARAEGAAGLEVANFTRALEAWNADRDDFEAFTVGLHHLAVYETRRGDYIADPTGRTLPAGRALLSSNWIKALRHRRLIGDDGRPSNCSGSAASFWSSVQSLKDARDKLLLQNHFNI